MWTPTVEPPRGFRLRRLAPARARGHSHRRDAPHRLSRVLNPPTAYRPLGYRMLERGLPRLWARGTLPWPDLEPATVLTQARRAVTGADFGPDEGWRPGLEQFLAACRNDAKLNAVGRMMSHGQALKILTERARTFARLTERPDWAARRLLAPLVIAGPMRSGTTRLQRLLALHPGLVHLRLFESNFPVPPRGRLDARPHLMTALLAAGRAVNPAIDAIHPMRARDPDEELGLLEQSFWGAQLEAQRPIPSYARWCERTDAAPAYAHLARLLRLIGGARGDPEGLPWLLKTPQHMANLPALFAAFPGARVIVTHRDPVSIVASSASLAWHSMVLQTDDLDPAWVGREWLHKTAQRFAAVAAFRAGPRAPVILDLAYEEMNRDPLGALGRALAFAGLDYPASVRLAATQWLAREAAKPRHAAHRYALEDFGLTRDEVLASV